MNHLAIPVIALIAVAGPLLYAVSNICDQKLSIVFNGHYSLQIAISKISQGSVALLILIYFFPHVHIGHWNVGRIGLCAILEFAYVYPYLKAFEKADTSIVVALFSLGKIFVPVLAFLTLGETLYPSQYLGFLIIIFSGCSITFDYKRFTFNPAVGFMLIVSIILAIVGLITKSVLNDGVAWIHFALMSATIEGLIGVVILVITPKQILSHYIGISRLNFLVIGTECVCSALGFTSITATLSYLPLSVMTGIGGLQPMFVLLLAYLIKKVAPSIRIDSWAGVSIHRKMIALILMIFGSILTVQSFS